MQHTFASTWTFRADDADAQWRARALSAAAFAASFAAWLARSLERDALTPVQLDVTAHVDLDEDAAPDAIAFDVVGTVPGVDEPTFAGLVRDACDAWAAAQPVVAEVTVSASLSAEQLAASAGP